MGHRHMTVRVPAGYDGARRREPHRPHGSELMDRITESFLQEFVEDHGLGVQSRGVVVHL